MATNPVDHFWDSANQDSGSVPPVDPAELRSIWTMQNGFPPLHPGQQIMLGAESCKQACRPGADVRSVFERVSHLSILQELGVLSPWLRDGLPDNAVFELPQPGLGLFRERRLNLISRRVHLSRFGYQVCGAEACEKITFQCYSCPAHHDSGG
jgi:hypothetical protein